MSELKSYVAVVCDWTDAESPVFVETELHGRSIGFEWHDREDGLKELHIPLVTDEDAKAQVIRYQRRIRELEQRLSELGG